MINAIQNCVMELSYSSQKNYSDSFNEVSLKLSVTCPDGSRMYIPGFWDGGRTWRVRFSHSRVGIYHYRTVCSDSSNGGLHGKEGEINVIPYTGSNPLYSHGPVRAGENKRYLEHADGKPFFWLGDTWWMGLTKRLKWPEDFKLLTSDRAEKGFSVVQIVSGLYPDMEWTDIRGANEGGFPWDKEFKSINPEYFNHADKKIAYLADSGIVPCIVGCWGFFAKLAGVDVIKKHWEYLVARWGAYPVVWCIAGEAAMSFYNDEEARKNLDEYKKKAVKDWTDITRHVKAMDPFGRLITIHPTDFGHKMVEDETLIDLNMLQTGHGGYSSFGRTVEMVRECASRQQHPFINGEVCYEGICGSCYEDVQRFVFWSCVLSGACGHTYGANGIWQVNSKEESYGVSPHGATWGDTPWEEAYKLPGSMQTGLGKKLLERFEWWRFEAHPEWINSEMMSQSGMGCFPAGIAGQVRVIFFHMNQCLGSIWGGVTVRELEHGVNYRAYWFNPATGEEDDLGLVTPDENHCWHMDKPKKLQDFVLVLVKA